MSTGLLLLAVAGCAPAAIDQAPTTASTPAAAAPLDVPAGAPLAEFFQKYDEAQLSLSPQTQAYRGIRDGDYGKWDYVSAEAEVRGNKQPHATGTGLGRSVCRERMRA